MPQNTLPDLNLLAPEALKALILSQHEQLLWTQDKLTRTHKQLLSREREIEHLQTEIGIAVRF